MAHQEYRGGDWVVVADPEDAAQTLADKRAAQVREQARAVAAIQAQQASLAAQAAAAQAELDALSATVEPVVPVAAETPVTQSAIARTPFYGGTLSQ